MYQIGGLIILGILAQWLSWRLKVPAILPLILTGMAVGPVAEYYLGHRLISPRFSTDLEGVGIGLFPNDLLYGFVSLAIGLILFEGGLTLKRSEIKGLGSSITRMTTLGSFTTSVVAGVAAHYIIGLTWQISFLFATLIVVTGPTVIAPIMRQLNVKRQIATILKWESIVIDPVGAFLAVLMFNFISALYISDETMLDAFLNFARSGLVGIALGVILGYILYQLIKHRFIPRYLLNVFLVASVMGAFLLSDSIVHESGLLTAVVMGATLANLDVPYLHDILDFKESLTILLISILFILLPANMSVEQIQLVVHPESLLLFAVVVFIARPLAVFWSLWGSGLKWNDKAFISWVGPRGIVAAGVASLFGFELEEMGVPGAEYVTPLVFLVVLGTVLLNATLAGAMARWLGVALPEGSGVLIFGGSEGALTIAGQLQESGRHVRVVTNSTLNAAEARHLQLDVDQVGDYNDDLETSIDFSDIGYILALSSNDENNFYLQNRYQKREGIRGFYRLISRKEVTNHRYSDVSLFSSMSTYLLFNRLARQYPKMSSIKVQDPAKLTETLEELREVKSIPIFLRCDKTGDIDFILAGQEKLTGSVGDELFYIGPEGIEQQVPLNEEVVAAMEEDETAETELSDVVDVEDGGTDVPTDASGEHSR